MDEWKLPNLERRLKCLIDGDTVRRRIAEMGAAIRRDFEGKEVVVIGTLKGSILFFSDLVRCIDLPLEMDFLGMSSYGNERTTSGQVRITSDLSKPIDGKHVIVIEDIVDTGLTMQFVTDSLKVRNPASVSVCTLLHKPSRTRVHVDMKYVGFVIEDKFVVGYGLDWSEKYRNVSFIGVVGEEDE